MKSQLGDCKLQYALNDQLRSEGSINPMQRSGTAVRLLHASEVANVFLAQEIKDCLRFGGTLSARGASWAIRTANHPYTDQQKTSTAAADSNSAFARSVQFGLALVMASREMILSSTVNIRVAKVVEDKRCHGL
ncbi:hypothetical protein FDV58_16670 [Bradyrhizobium elkanii]|uniref:Uncharacterized protein n=1 Tax=Bradyrhizobium elkanii TaxID=29448 RepID=A0A4U6S109_BRAEL|nr:hypothetical protein [Bradyrhizobium elkanii]TKV80403.1 hypothetical protein FDV58_16670 [Bradyrhizobium elkanii]